MKSILTLLAACCLITSCANTTDTERLQRIGDIALTYAERTGKITPQDAAIAREAGQLLLTKESAPVVVTSGK